MLIAVSYEYTGCNKQYSTDYFSKLMNLLLTILYKTL